MNRLPAMAIRNVGRNKRRSLLTGVTIVLGVTAITVMNGFIAGVQRQMTEDVVLSRTGALQVHKAGYVGNIEASPLRLNMPYDPALLARIRAVPGVTGVTGRIQFQGLVSNGTSQTMFVGRGVDLEREKDACPNADLEVRQGGTPLRPGDGRRVLVGFELGESFGTTVGKTITLQSSSPGGRTNAVDLEVKGLTVSNLPFENKRVATVSLETAQALLGLEGRVTEYAVAVEDLGRLEPVRLALQRELGDAYEVHAWGDLQPLLRDIINRQRVIFAVIAVVLFLIVLTGIINTMLMSVFERVREIGTLLAVGVRRSQVMGLFMLEAIVLGFGGALTGALLGKAVVTGFALRGIQISISGASRPQVLRPEASVAFLAGAVVLALVGALVASAWPAWRASRLNPVDALRNT